MTKKISRLGIGEVDIKLEQLDLEPILLSKKRQVRFLYNNSNKLTMVYEEKLVRVIVHRLQERIKELESIIALDDRIRDIVKVQPDSSPKKDYACQVCGTMSKLPVCYECFCKNIDNPTRNG